MAKINYDGHIVYSKEDDIIVRRKKLVKSLISIDSKQAESQISDLFIYQDKNAEGNNLLNNPINDLTYIKDEYGNRIKYDSDGIIQEMTVTPLKID